MELENIGGTGLYKQISPNGAHLSAPEPLVGEGMACLNLMRMEFVFSESLSIVAVCSS